MLPDESNTTRVAKQGGKTEKGALYIIRLKAGKFLLAMVLLRNRGGVVEHNSGVESGMVGSDHM